MPSRAAQPITVVHIITKMELGGAQRNTLYTVQHLDSQMFRVYLLTGPGGELLDEARGCAGWRCIPDLIREISPRRDLAALLQIRRAIKRIRADAPEGSPLIIHTHSSKAGILGRWAAWLAGVRIIVHSVHGFGFHEYQKRTTRLLYQMLERISSGITTRFIVVSEANRRTGEEAGIFSGDQACLIRSGIDIQAFASAPSDPMAVRRELGIAPDVPLITMVACFKPQKAPLDFVRACAAVHHRHPEACFLLAGDGELRPRIEASVAENGLGKIFFMPGWRRDIAALLHASQIAVLSSYWEGLPQVVPQACAAGLPVVATRVDGTPEIVRNGVNGFLVPPGETGLLAEKIIYLLDHPEEARAMGQASQGMTAGFDITIMVKQQEQLYGQLAQYT
jgi:glycosyltransferase involved in cell wall biosynthesis